MIINSKYIIKNIKPDNLMIPFSLKTIQRIPKDIREFAKYLSDTFPNNLIESKVGSIPEV